ncbi:MAG: hypothetical protein V1934_00490 [Methanobacteriota archaeon]
MLTGASGFVRAETPVSTIEMNVYCHQANERISIFLISIHLTDYPTEAPQTRLFLAIRNDAQAGDPSKIIHSKELTGTWKHQINSQLERRANNSESWLQLWRGEIPLTFAGNLTLQIGSLAVTLIRPSQIEPDGTSPIVIEIRPSQIEPD